MKNLPLIILKIEYNNGKIDGIKEQITRIGTKIEETKIALHDVILVKRTNILLPLVQKPDATNATVSGNMSFSITLVASCF